MHSKKGAAGHIEIIISFLIFIAFVVFLLVFINPIEKTKDNKHYFEITEKAIMEYLKANLTTFSVNFEPEVLLQPDRCVCIDYDYPANNKVVGKDDVYNRVPAITTGDYLCIELIIPKKFYRLYFSEEFTEETGACEGTSHYNVLSEDLYTLGVLNKYEKISNKSLYSLNQAYDTNYENLRTNILNLNNYFNIEVRTTDGVLLAYGKIQEPKEENIIARDIPIEVINENGDTMPAIMNLQVWE